MSKTNEELEVELALRASERKEREISDKEYAAKIVEKIVFGFLGLLAVSVVGAMVGLVLK